MSDGADTYLYGLGRIGEQDSSSWDYHLSDTLGSVRQLTDGSGTVTMAQIYQPFGKASATFGTASSSYAFAGEMTDASGMQYLRARYYAPSTGRFISRDVWQGDPLQPMGYNLWLYIYSNPVNYIDPSGEWGWVALGAAVGAAIGYGTQVVENYKNGHTGTDAWTYDIDANKIIGGAIAGAGAVIAAPAVVAAASEFLAGTAMVTGSASLMEASIATATVATGMANVLYGPLSGTVERFTQATTSYSNMMNYQQSWIDDGSDFEYVTQEETIMYRYWDSRSIYDPNTYSKQNGGYLSPYYYPTQAEAQNNLALVNFGDKINSGDMVSQVIIPPGTTCWQTRIMPNFGLNGNGIQVQLLDQISKSNFGLGVPTPIGLLGSGLQKVMGLLGSGGQ